MVSSEKESPSNKKLNDKYADCTTNKQYLATFCGKSLSIIKNFDLLIN